MRRRWLDTVSVTDVPWVVRFSDHRLGVWKIVLTSLTIIFCVLKVIIIDGGHLSRDVPVGLAHATLNAPTTAPPAPYCNTTTPCLSWDPPTMRTDTGPNVATIPTMVETLTQTRTCDASHICTWATGASSHHRVSHPEAFRLHIEHMYQSPKFYQDWADANPEDGHRTNPWWGTQATLPGFLRDQKDRVIQRFGTTGPDTADVGHFLSAAGVDLDLHRDAGMVLFVSISYHNRPSYQMSGPSGWPAWSFLSPQLDELQYTYRVAKLPSATYSWSEVTQSDDTTRTVRITHGIRMCFVHTGDTLALSWSLLVLTSSAAITLLQFSDQIVIAIGQSLLVAKWGQDAVVFSPQARKPSRGF